MYRKVEASQSPVDGLWRRWEEYTYTELGLMPEEDVVRMNGYNPTKWIVTGVFETENDALRR